MRNVQYLSIKHSKKWKIKFHRNHYRRRFFIKIPVNKRRLQNNVSHNTMLPLNISGIQLLLPTAITTTLLGATISPDHQDVSQLLSCPPTVYFSTTASQKRRFDLCGSTPSNGSPFFQKKRSRYHGPWGLIRSAPTPPPPGSLPQHTHLLHQWIWDCPHIHSVCTSHIGFFAVPWTSKHTPNSMCLNTWFPGPGTLFPRVSAWLSPLPPANLSLNIIVLIKLSSFKTTIWVGLSCSTTTFLIPLTLIYFLFWHNYFSLTCNIWVTY